MKILQYKLEETMNWLEENKYKMANKSEQRRGRKETGARWIKKTYIHGQSYLLKASVGRLDHDELQSNY